jgi:large subunit ribosomal protein L6e
MAVKLGKSRAGKLVKRNAKLLAQVKVDKDAKLAVSPLAKWKSYKKPILHKVQKKSFKSRPHKLRPSLTPGTVVIILAGKSRGRRAVLIKDLGNGTLLVHGKSHQKCFREN